MTHENYELGKKMLAFTNLKDYDIEIGEKAERIYYITYKGKRQYELWEMSSIWSVSLLDEEKHLLKKHEDFYFALKFLLTQLVDKSMDEHFGKKEETFELE